MNNAPTCTPPPRCRAGGVIDQLERCQRPVVYACIIGCVHEHVDTFYACQDCSDVALTIEHICISCYVSDQSHMCSGTAMRFELTDAKKEISHEG